MPRIAVVISTRDRGAAAADAARAVLAEPTDLELVVVDQSADDRTASALASIDDPRLSVIRSQLRGLSNGRNDGVASTTAPYVAFTDDDCRVPVGWARAMLAALEGPPGAGMACGAVVGEAQAPGDFLPEFRPTIPVVVGRMPDSMSEVGIGASFAIRRDLLERLGGFDPLLGAGAPRFRGAEELDLYLRAVSSGERVVNVLEMPVRHLGVRRGADVRRLIVGYRIANGAAFGKHARLTPRIGIRDCVRRLSGDLGDLGNDIIRRRRPRPGVVFYFLLGVLQSFRYGVDRHSQRFVSRARSGR